MKRTPGPWVTHESYYIYGQDGKFIAKTTGNAKPYRNDIEERANAHLIASSPELLEACKAIKKWSETVTPTRLIQELDPIILQVKQAIAKAEGRD